ncbi:uncharacterized protein LOC132057912 [Lycium ferocissimum]|uniref:uncharacterized protein LOC132057912 n=1 Tax=Lycium ferocissimum TaxID=112874 RepID=UPI0028160564|nr:uncharacterized protein LOC132057912 [Lycium ferocissimum]
MAMGDTSETTETTSGVTSYLDYNHPLYLQSSDTPGVALHSIQLIGPENYALWSRSMRSALLVKNKLVLWHQNLYQVSCMHQMQEKLKDYWDKLDVSIPPPCSCYEAKPYVEHTRNVRLLQFLVGLNESYSQVRSEILQHKSALSINEAYSMVI